jgi:hypothetical protein
MPEDALTELRKWMLERGREAPRTRLRVTGTSTGSVDEPLLVCAACTAWTRHRRPAGSLPPSSAERGRAVEDLFDCEVCHVRRQWGTRFVMRLV